MGSADFIEPAATRQRKLVNVSQGGHANPRTKGSSFYGVMTFPQHDISTTCHLTKLRWVCWLDEHSVADLHPGSGAFLPSGSMMNCFPDPGSWLPDLFDYD
jgi:hypothetical protein